MIARTAAVIMALMLIALPGFAQMTLDWPDGTLVLGEDARVQSLIERTSGQELGRRASQGIVMVRVGEDEYHANELEPIDGGFRLRFDGTDTVLDYAVEPAESWLLLTLDAVAGTRPEMVSLRIPVEARERLGRRLNIVWDDELSVCLMAGNLQVRPRLLGTNHPVLSADTQDFPGPRLEGAAVALIATPTERFKAVAREVSHACGLPTNETADGIPVKDTDLVRGSYWFIRVEPGNVEQIIEYCHEAGIGQVMMTSSSWCRNVGHYTFRDTYPNGVEDLKAIVERFHDNGILVGMHCFVSKVSKTDAYVTPVPDRRFWVDMQDTLAADISADATEITVTGDLSQWAGSSQVAGQYWEGGVDKHRECIIGDEIIKYASIGPEGVWNTFYGCERGAWGTDASAHAAGKDVRHYGVDGCINGYIIDQETDLMDEVADRIADIFNYCGFDMVYFDGGEDVDRRRFHYYATNFQNEMMRRVEKRPTIHMGTILTHRLWHSFARSGTVDTYLNTLHAAVIGGRQIDQWPTVREHIDRSVTRNVSLADDMMPAELGWFGIWPAGANTDGLQLDEFEYLLCKSLAMDSPISLQTDIESLRAHALTPAILEMFRRYEELRMARALPAEMTAPLGEIGRDFVILQDGGQVRFAEVEPLEHVGGTRDVRAQVGAVEGGSVATIWHYLGREGLAEIQLPAQALALTDFGGEAIDFEAQGDLALIPVGARRHTLLAAGVGADALRAALESATLRIEAPLAVWVSARDLDRVEGEMALGSDVGVSEDGALSGDVLVCTANPSFSDPQPWFAEYTVEIPRAGIWTLWARVRYPRGEDDSFGFVLPGDEVTLRADQVLGNCGQNDAQWHWTGRGAGSGMAPPGRPIRLQLEPGPFTFRIYAREGAALEVNPRLDLLCFTEDAVTVPDDEMAREALEEGDGGRM